MIDIDISHATWSENYHVYLEKVKIEKRRRSFNPDQPPLELESYIKNISNVTFNFKSDICSVYYQNVMRLKPKCTELFTYSFNCVLLLCNILLGDLAALIYIRH